MFVGGVSMLTSLLRSGNGRRSTGPADSPHPASIEGVERRLQSFWPSLVRWTRICHPAGRHQLIGCDLPTVNGRQMRPSRKIGSAKAPALVAQSPLAMPAAFSAAARPAQARPQRSDSPPGRDAEMWRSSPRCAPPEWPENRMSSSWKEKQAQSCSDDWWWAKDSSSICPTTGWCTIE